MHFQCQAGLWLPARSARAASPPAAAARPLGRRARANTIMTESAWRPDGPATCPSLSRRAVAAGWASESCAGSRGSFKPGASHGPIILNAAMMSHSGLSDSGPSQLKFAKLNFKFNSPLSLGCWAARRPGGPRDNHEGTRVRSNLKSLASLSQQ